MDMILSGDVPNTSTYDNSGRGGNMVDEWGESLLMDKIEQETREDEEQIEDSEQQAKHNRRLMEQSTGFHKFPHVGQGYTNLGASPGEDAPADGGDAFGGM